MKDNFETLWPAAWIGAQSQLKAGSYVRPKFDIVVRYRGQVMPWGPTTIGQIKYITAEQVVVDLPRLGDFALWSDGRLHVVRCWTRPSNAVSLIAL